MVSKGKISKVGQVPARVLLVDPHRAYSSLLNKALIDNGYEVVELLFDIERMIDRAMCHHPDVLVIGIDMPEPSSIRYLARLKEEHPLPVVMFAEKETPQIIEQVVRAGVSAFVVDDVQPQRFNSIISVAIERFKVQKSLITELERAKSQLAGRKVLDKAKGLLMSQKGLSEDEAYTRLRKMAMDKGLPIAKVAENIIDVLGMLDSDTYKPA
jgi:two-component system, response regulator / RNA-binding antiterminator